MIDLNELRYGSPHPLKALFDNYDRGQIANKLGIPTLYFNYIIQGYDKPFPEIEKRMHELAEAIKEAEELENA